MEAAPPPLNPGKKWESVVVLQARQMSAASLYNRSILQLVGFWPIARAFLSPARNLLRVSPTLLLRTWGPSPDLCILYIHTIYCISNYLTIQVQYINNAKDAAIQYKLYRVAAVFWPLFDFFSKNAIKRPVLHILTPNFYRMFTGIWGMTSPKKILTILHYGLDMRP
jgi:hypothetical protein